MFSTQSKNYWMNSHQNLIDGKDKKEFDFKEELYLFLNTTICHCYRHLAQVNRSKYERLMWACIQLFGAYSLYYLITTSYQGFVANPLVTTLHDTIYPVKFIPFPAVTVCSNNRISKKEATKFAKELSLIDPEKRDEEFFLNQIKFLGRAYDFETENEHLMTAFQQFLDEISVASITPITENSTLKEQMKFSKIIKRLTPRCEDLVLKCFFNSKIYPCMLKYEMLEQRKSIYGYCCSFNYLNRKDSNPLNTPYYSEVTGKDMGLILLIDQMQDDYFYNIFNNVGVTILIHGHDEYPDPLTGSASERLILPGEEVFIRVDGSNIHSQDDILSYKAEQRQCLFPNEILQYNGRYARSECFLSCKVRSIQALCDCLPFNIPKTTIGIGSGEPKTCTLQHVPCLNKYKVKWLTIMSDIISIEGLEREMEESLICRDCYASCHDNKYRLTTSSLPLVVNNRSGFGITNGIGYNRIHDVSLIRVFFGQRESLQFYTDVSFLWYEIFSSLGGLFGVVGGFSLIGLTETVYFIIKQTILFIFRKINLKIKTKELMIYP